MAGTRFRSKGRLSCIGTTDGNPHDPLSAGIARPTCYGTLLRGVRKETGCGSGTP
jgi:hypothetical protein